MNEEFEEGLRTFKRLLETTAWAGVSPSGKAVLFDLLNRLVSESDDLGYLYDEVGKRLGLDPLDVRDLCARGNEYVVDYFNRPVRYETDWIQTYLDFTSNHEAPELFHFWTACSILSAATSRRVWLDQNYYKVFPNLFIVLVAPAGRCRRSVATNIGVRILRDAGVTSVLSEKITPEGLAMALHNVGEGGKTNAALHIHAPELSVFLGRQQYNEGLIALLTTLYDCPDTWEYVTRTKSEIQLRHVYLTMLGATAPDWLADSIPPVAFGGGFLSRTLIIAASATPRVFPFPMPRDPSLQEQLTSRLRGIAQRTGGFTFSPEGKKWYENWYDEMRKTPLDASLISGYYERKQDHIIRVATLLTLAKEKDELVYEPDVLQEALSRLEQMEPFLPLAFKHIGVTNEGRSRDQVLSYMRRHGGACSKTKLLHHFVGRLAKRDLDDIVDTLQAAGLLRYDNDTSEWALTDRGWFPDSSLES